MDATREQDEFSGEQEVKVGERNVLIREEHPQFLDTTEKLLRSENISDIIWEVFCNEKGK